MRAFRYMLGPRIVRRQYTWGLESSSDNAYPGARVWRSTMYLGAILIRQPYTWGLESSSHNINPGARVIEQQYTWGLESSGKANQMTQEQEK